MSSMSFVPLLCINGVRGAVKDSADVVVKTTYFIKMSGFGIFTKATKYESSCCGIMSYKVFSLRTE